MGYSATESHAALTVFQGCLLVSLQADLYDDVLAGIREETLRKIHSKTVQGVIFDMSTVKVLDTYAFKHLADTGKMAMILGVEAVFAGFQPGAVSALVDMEADTASVRTFRTCEEALTHLTAHLFASEETDNSEQDEDNPEIESDDSAPVMRYA